MVDWFREHLWILKDIIAPATGFCVLILGIMKYNQRRKEYQDRASFRGFIKWVIGLRGALWLFDRSKLK